MPLLSGPSADQAFGPFLFQDWSLELVGVYMNEQDRNNLEITFKVDGQEVSASEIRVEFKDWDEGFTLIYVLTREGLIRDLWERGGKEPRNTSSAMYADTAYDLLEGESD